MIEPAKLFHLTGGQKRRKLALTFGALERDIAGIAEKGHEYAFNNLTRCDYTKKLAELLLKGELEAGKTLKIGVKADQLKFEIV